MHSIKYVIILFTVVSLITLLIVFTMATTTLQFSDNGETWDAGTDCNSGGSTIPWDVCSVNGEGDLQGHASFHSGTYAVRADDFDTSFRALQETIDSSTCDNITIEFYYAGYGIDSGEYAKLEFFDGTWTTLMEFNGAHDQQDSTPDPIDYTFYSTTILSGDYTFSSSTEIGWTFFIGGATDLFYFDDLNVTCNFIGTDTCSCPELNNDWEIEMSDDCVIIDNCNLGTGQLNFTGTGTFTCNATINTTSTGLLYDSQIVYIDENCIMDVT